MGLSHLPSELTVPHLSEPDAISARATVSATTLGLVYNMMTLWANIFAQYMGNLTFQRNI